MQSRHICACVFADLMVTCMLDGHILSCRDANATPTSKAALLLVMQRRCGTCQCCSQQFVTIQSPYITHAWPAR